MPVQKCPIWAKPKFSKAIWLLTLLLTVACSSAASQPVPAYPDSGQSHEEIPTSQTLCHCLWGFPAGAGHPSPSPPLANSHCFRRVSVRITLSGKSSCPWSDWNPLSEGFPGAYPVFLSQAMRHSIIIICINYMPSIEVSWGQGTYLIPLTPQSLA